MHFTFTKITAGALISQHIKMYRHHLKHIYGRSFIDCVVLELVHDKAEKGHSFASQSLYFWTDMGPGSAYELHQVA